MLIHFYEFQSQPAQKNPRIDYCCFWAARGILAHVFLTDESSPRPVIVGDEFCTLDHLGRKYSMLTTIIEPQSCIGGGQTSS